MLNIIQIPVLIDNYIYLLIDKDTSKCACVDPALSQPVIDVLNKLNLNLDFILNTHHHNDHVGANLELKNKYNCKIAGNENDKKRIPGIDIFLQEDDNLQIGKSECKVIEVSGHTLGHICFYFKNNNAIFCGDTLFSLGCGRLFEGTPIMMWKTLNQFKNLPHETKIYSGHEYAIKNLEFALSIDSENKALQRKYVQIKDLIYRNLPSVPSTIKDELEINPFLRANTKEIKTALNMLNDTNENVFAELRRRRDSF